ALELFPAARPLRPRGVSGELRQLRRAVDFSHHLRAVHAGPRADPPLPGAFGPPGAADGRGIPDGALRICSGESGGATGAPARLPDGDALALGRNAPVDPARGDRPSSLVRLLPAPSARRHNLDGAPVRLDCVGIYLDNDPRGKDRRHTALLLSD